MATVESVMPAQILFFQNNVVVIQWTGVTGADTCTPVMGGGFADRSFQVQGAFDGATVVCEGSNDGVNFHTLHNTFSDSLTFTAADLEQVLEVTRYIRPRVSGGGGSTAVDVTLFCRNVPER